MWRGSERHGQRLERSVGRRPDPDDRPADGVIGDSPEELLEHDPGLEPGERRTEAMVDAVPERDVPLRVAADVEPVGITPPALVPIRRGPDQRDPGAVGDQPVVYDDVARRGPRERLDR